MNDRDNRLRAARIERLKLGRAKLSRIVAEADRRFTAAILRERVDLSKLPGVVVIPADSVQTELREHASDRFRSAFAWATETYAAAAATNEHVFVLDLSHYVGGSVTLAIRASGHVQLSAAFDAPAALSVGIMSRRTGELLDLHIDEQVTELITVERPMYSSSFSVDLARHEMDEIVVVAYE